jgi:hypothetical protein
MSPRLGLLLICLAAVPAQSAQAFARTRLEQVRVQRAYRHQLVEAFDAFVHFTLLLDPLPPATWPQSAEVADHLLSMAVNHWHDAGHRMYRARLLILGVQFRFPQLRGKLPRSWDCIRSWRLRLPARHRTPLPLEGLWGLFCQAWRLVINCPERSGLLVPFAVLLLVGWHGLMRPAELIGVTARDCAFVASGVVVIALRQPKNFATYARNQFVVIRDTTVISWLRWLLHKLPAPTKLWPSDLPRFRLVFQWVVDSLGLSGLGLLPSSLRAGGATGLFIAGVAVDRIQFMGRWKCPQTLSAYIQEAMTALIWAHTDQNPSLREVLTFLPALGSPPSRPWYRMFSRRRQSYAQGASALRRL